MRVSQLILFPHPPPGQYPVAVTPDIEHALTRHAPVAIGVSGGKDSSAVAIRTVEYLDEIGHQGPRVLIHFDLGRIEWKQSLPMCEQLADRLRLELIVVRRQAGDLLSRWQQRWANNKVRYASLSCGIRKAESAARAHAPIAREQPRLLRKTSRTAGWDWHPILDWSLDEVFAFLGERNCQLHEAYRVYGSSRVSCAFCILSSKSDLAAAVRCADNASVYRALVSLEVESTFAFQQKKWLADVAPALLDEGTRNAVEIAKQRAQEREEAEARIPQDLLYEAGWPKRCPTEAEARLLADVRRTVCASVGLEETFTTSETVVKRYRELLAASSDKDKRTRKLETELEQLEERCDERSPSPRLDRT